MYRYHAINILLLAALLPGCIGNSSSSHSPPAQPTTIIDSTQITEVEEPVIDVVSIPEPETDEVDQPVPESVVEPVPESPFEPEPVAEELKKLVTTDYAFKNQISELTIVDGKIYGKIVSSTASGDTLFDYHGGIQVIDVATMKSLAVIDKTDKHTSQYEFSKNRHHIKDSAIGGDAFYILGDDADDVVGGYTAPLGVEKFDINDYTSQGLKEAVYPDWMSFNPDYLDQEDTLYVPTGIFIGAENQPYAFNRHYLYAFATSSEDKSLIIEHRYQINDLALGEIQEVEAKDGYAYVHRRELAPNHEPTFRISRNTALSTWTNYYHAEFDPIMALPEDQILTLSEKSPFEKFGSDIQTKEWTKSDIMMAGALSLDPHASAHFALADSYIQQANKDSIQIFDLTTSDEPLVVSTPITKQGVRIDHIRIAGNFLEVYLPNRVEFYNIEDPKSPEFVSALPLDTFLPNTWGDQVPVFVGTERAYQVNLDERKFYVYDISQPGNIKKIASADISLYPIDLCAYSDGKVYLTGHRQSQKIIVIDVQGI